MLRVSVGSSSKKKKKKKNCSGPNVEGNRCSRDQIGWAESKALRKVGLNQGLGAIWKPRKRHSRMFNSTLEKWCYIPASKSLGLGKLKDDNTWKLKSQRAKHSTTQQVRL